MSGAVNLRALIKDGCILRNRKGYEFIAMPSLGIDIDIESEEMKDENEDYRPMHENMPTCLCILDENLNSRGGHEYDIVEIKYMGEVLWSRAEPIENE